jgi:hypothetical protein
MYNRGKKPCHMQVSVIDTLSFLKSVKKAQTYSMLLFSQQCMILHLTVAYVFKVFKALPMNSYCSRTCMPVGSQNVNIWTEGSACCCVCQTFALVWTGGKHIFLEWTLTCDETWVPHFTSEQKWSSMVWHHSGLPPPKKLKKQLLAGKIMASVLWDSGLINVYFLSHYVTVSSLLYSDVHQVIRCPELATQSR